MSYSMLDVNGGMKMLFFLHFLFSKIYNHVLTQSLNGGCLIET